MTPEQQRIAIAEACGWTRCVCGDPECGAWFAPDASPDDPCLGPPDYLNDLNAMHEAEMMLNRKQYLNYVTELGYVVGNTGVEYYDLIRATAAQRAEAFLRALGKWVEGSC